MIVLWIALSLLGLGRAVPIEFDVRLPDGSQPSSARIDWEPVDSARASVCSPTPATWTPRARVVDLPPMLVRVSAVCDPEHGGDGWFLSAATTVDVRQAQSRAIVLDLQPRSGIAITLTLDGQRVDGTLFVRDLGEAEPVDLERLATKGEEHPITTRGAFVDAPPGRYVVGATLGRGLPVTAYQIVGVVTSAVETSVALDSARATHAFEVELLIKGVRYSGNLDVTVEATRGGFPMAIDWRHVRRSDGSFLLIPDAPGIRLLNAVESGEIGAATTVVLTLFGRDGRTTSFGVPLRPEPRRISVFLDDIAHVELTVTGKTPEGLALRAALQPRASIAHWPSELDRAPDGSWADVVAGRASMGPVPATAADVVLYAMVDGVPSHAVTAEAIDLAAGTNAITIELPALHEARIAVDPPVAELRLFRFAIGPPIRGDVVQGEARFRHLPAGEYLLSSDAPGLTCQDVPFVVPQTGTAHFDPPPLDAVRVQVVDPMGSFASVGFQADDRIIGMNGKRFRDDPRGALSVSGVAGVPTDFLVLRAGELIEVTLTLPWSTPDPARDGIRFVPSSTVMDTAIQIESRGR